MHNIEPIAFPSLAEIKAETEYNYWSREVERLGILYITARKNWQQAKENFRKTKKK